MHIYKVTKKGRVLNNNYNNNKCIHLFLIKIVTSKINYDKLLYSSKA